MNTKEKAPVLTKMEQEYFDLLLSNIGRVVPRERFTSIHYKPDSYSNVIDRQIANLRPKIADRYTLTSERGVGYRLDLI